MVVTNGDLPMVESVKTHQLNKSTFKNMSFFGVWEFLKRFLYIFFVSPGFQYAFLFGPLKNSQGQKGKIKATKNSFGRNAHHVSRVLNCLHKKLHGLGQTVAQQIFFLKSLDLHSLKLTVRP